MLVTQRILAGFLNRGEILAQSQGLVHCTNPSAKANFWRDVRAARAARSSLTPDAATPPVVEDLPASAMSHINEVVATDLFQDNFGGFDYRFVQVPLQQLQTVQIFVNDDARLTPPSVDSPSDFLRYCLPTEVVVDGCTTMTATGVRFSSDRYGLGPQNVCRRTVGGQFSLSFEHLNLLQVRSVNGRYIVFNGTHRVWKLLSAGRSTAPALLITHSDPNEVPWPQGPGFWSPQFMMGPRPAYVGDFSTALAVQCPIELVQTVVDVNLSFGTPHPSQSPQQVALQLNPNLIRVG